MALLRVAVLVSSLCVTAPSLAVPIRPGAFTGGESVESFEGHAPGPNFGYPLAGVLEPGLAGPVVFASGAQLASAPNPGVFADGAFLHDWILEPNAVVNDWLANGRIDSAAAVPFGGAYLGVFDSPRPPTDPVAVAFQFAQDVARVGAWVAGRADSSITLTVYDGLGNPLESATLAAGSVAGWSQDDHFLGLQAAAIRTAVFSGADFGLDGLTFESATHAPEPGTALLLATGLLALSLARARAAGSAGDGKP